MGNPDEAILDHLLKFTKDEVEELEKAGGANEAGDPSVTGKKTDD